MTTEQYQIGYEAGYSEGFDAGAKPADGYITIPRETFDQMREALVDIKHGIEGARIWGGMEWTYNPLHSFKYLPLIDKAEQALSAAKAVSGLTNRYTEQPQGDAKADCLCGRYEFCPDCQPGLFGEVQPTITNSESRDPQASEPAAPEDTK